MASDQDDDKGVLTLLPVSDEAGGKDNSDPEPEEDDEEDGDGDGSGDQTALALDVPEPEQAMAANEALAKGGKNQMKGKGKGKGKKGLKDGKAGIDVVLDEAMIGLEEQAGEPSEAEAESAEISAYDSDEITDPDHDDIDPLMVLVGAREKPWENEKLSLVERMMLDPGYERDLEAAGRGENGADQDKAKDKAAKIGKMAATAAGAAALGVAAAKGAQAARNDLAARPQDRSGQGVAGIAKGPQRAADQDRSAPHKAEQRKADNTTQFNNTQPITYQARQNAQEVTMRRMANGLAASLDNKSAASLNAARNPPLPRTPSDEIDDNLMQMIESHLRSEYQGMNWTPQAVAGDGFRQAMDMIYAALGTENLLEVSPYRQAGWDEKRLEHKENSQDVTIAAPAPEPKAPAPEPSLEREPQINFGPGGM